MEDKINRPQVGEGLQEQEARRTWRMLQNVNFIVMMTCEVTNSKNKIRKGWS